MWLKCLGLKHHTKCVLEARSDGTCSARLSSLHQYIPGRVYKQEESNRTNPKSDESRFSREPVVSGGVDQCIGTTELYPVRPRDASVTTSLLRSSHGAVGCVNEEAC